jgi:hypothetical protein
MAWHEQREGKHPSYLFKLKLTGNEKKTTSSLGIRDIFVMKQIARAVRWDRGSHMIKPKIAGEWWRLRSGV